MKSYNLWTVSDGKPIKLPQGEVGLEKDLEDWIEHDPSLLQSGLKIVGRQLRTECGPLDLLALDPQGRWAVIEIKRGELTRQTIAQVVDYASCLAEMPEPLLREKLEGYLSVRGMGIDMLLEERRAPHALYPDQREVMMFVVGTTKEPNLDRMAAYLTNRYSVPLTVVTLQTFRQGDGSLLLAREISELENQPPTNESATESISTGISRVRDIASQGGMVRLIDQIIAIAESKGLYVRPWRTCVMFAPPQNRTRALFTLWPSSKEKSIRAWVGNEVFSEFFPVTSEQIANELASEGYHTYDEHQFTEFVESFDKVDLNPQSVENSDT